LDPKRPIAKLVARPSAQTSLLAEKLAERIGEANAARLITEALARSARDEIPCDADDLLNFTKAHLIDDLVTAIGARAVSGFLDDLREAARLRSGVRTSSGSDEVIAIVAIVDRDVFRRANTARQLIARRMQVLALQKLEDLLTESTRPDVVIVEEADALSPGLFRILSLPGFDPAIVLLAPEGSGTRALAHAGVGVFEATGSNSPVDIASVVERVLLRKM
jgi:hypothetical protein